jgi:hypothetical protein
MLTCMNKLQVRALLEVLCPHATLHRHAQKVPLKDSSLSIGAAPHLHQTHSFVQLCEDEFDASVCGQDLLPLSQHTVNGFYAVPKTTERVKQDQ